MTGPRSRARRWEPERGEIYPPRTPREMARWDQLSEEHTRSLAAAVLRVAGERPNGDGFFIPVPARPAEDARCGSAPCTRG